jgi:hypothetical protein
MYDEVSSSNPPDLPMPAEGAYVWHLEVIVVAVGIDPVSREYETGPVVDSASIKKKKKIRGVAPSYHLVPNAAHTRGATLNPVGPGLPPSAERSA